MFLIDDIKALLSKKDLIRYILLTELKSNFKGTVLGFFWMLLDPLMMMLVYAFLVVVIFGRGGPQFPVLLFSALISWNWFSKSVSNSIKTYVSNGKLIQTISVPLSVFPVAKVLLGMVTFLASLVALIPMLFFFDATINLNILWLPVIVFSQLIFTLGISLLFSVGGMYFADLSNIMQFTLKLLFYFSPALYSLDSMPDKFAFIKPIYEIVNPFVSLFESYKNVLVHGTPPNEYLLLFFAEGVLFVVLGLYWLKKSHSFIVKNV
jgi:ABC-type polysaccharide/polyol phosphate export permease